ncbi:hypothetical protein LTR85_010526 [Meristemomyces frigidus]|nr:hypothetical protein LTR85_010526 [Meristemomyces frigidus]
MEKSWKWEAPSVQIPPLGAGPPPPPPKAAAIFQWTAEPRKHARRGVAAQEARAILASLQPTPDPVTTSRDAFQKLLSSLETQLQIDKASMTTLVDFLQTSADEPEAMNTAALAQWLLARTITDEALQLFAQAIRDKVTLRTLSHKQLIPALALLVQRGVHADVSACLTQILEAVPESGRDRVISKVSRYLKSTTDEELSAIRFWFRVLDACSYMGGMHYEHAIWAGVYHQFARHVGVVELAEHLGALEHLDFAQVILRFWVPHLQANDDEPSALSCRGHQSLAFRRGAKASESDVRGLIADFEALRETKYWTSAETVRKPTDFPLVDLLAILARRHIPYTQLLNDSFTAIKQTKHPLALWGLFRALNHHPELGMPKQLATDLIHYFLNSDDPRDVRRAWLVFKNVPAISVQQFFELPLKLIEHGYGTPDRIFRILNRKVGEDIAFPDERGTPRLALQAEHIDLVHLVAYAWASQEQPAHPGQSANGGGEGKGKGKGGSRVAFRRVWQCYRFLQDRGAPLSVLMSRALVKAGILRPLAEGKYVPLAQVRYIVSLVQRLEGEAIAANLDRIVFAARKRNRVEGGYEMWWAGRMDEGIARATRWRLRLWARAGSRLWFGSGGVVVGKGRGRERREARRRWMGLKPSEVKKGGSGGDWQLRALATLKRVEPDSAHVEVLRREVDDVVGRERSAERSESAFAEQEEEEDGDDYRALALDSQQYSADIDGDVAFKPWNV